MASPSTDSQDATHLPLSSRLTGAGTGLLARVARIGADPGDDEDVRLGKALLVLVSVAILPVSVVWGLLYLALGSPVGFVPLVYFAVSIAAIAVFARTRDINLLLRIELVDILLSPTLSAIPLGGFLASGGVGMWGMLAPLGALIFDDVRAALRWLVAFVAVFVGSGLVGELGGGISRLPAWFNTTMLALNVSVSFTIVFGLLAVFVHQRRVALSALRVEQDKAENLLLNVLPRSIAERLKAEPQTIADQYDSASILFADVVDFTGFAQRLPAADVVGTLDSLFSRFDTLAERYGLEKIKTIGDCYMVAAGVPAARPDHAVAISNMALDMLDAVRPRDSAGRRGLELRVGINSGPVIAGVIGRKRFLYDLWGDAVNTASRMESHGSPGQIQITRATYDLVKDEFVCQRRGMVEVKGKGQMETWYLTGRLGQARPVRSSSSPTSKEPADGARRSRRSPATASRIASPANAPKAKRSP